MEKVNPYNQNNKLVTENDIINIMETLNINDFKISPTCEFFVFY